LVFSPYGFGLFATENVLCVLWFISKCTYLNTQPYSVDDTHWVMEYMYYNPFLNNIPLYIVELSVFQNNIEVDIKVNYFHQHVFQYAFVSLPEVWNILEILTFLLFISYLRSLEIRIVDIGRRI
jgi:hypothetical protein